jgi:HSP20 family molecular chaperone IbpA
MPSIMLRGGMSAPSSVWNLLDDLDRSITPMWTWSPRRAATWPEFDVQHTEDAVVITADVPGLAEQDLAVTLTGRSLTIEGKAQRRGYEGAFSRTFELAEGLDHDKLEASLERGVLTIYLPKSEAARPRRVAIGSGGVLDKVKALIGRGRDGQEVPSAG